MSRVCRYLFPLLALLTMLARDGRAQGADPYKNFPVPFGPNNAGKEFWLAFPANWDDPTASQYYVRLYITAGVKTQVRVWIGGSIRKVLTTIPYDVVTVDLNPTEAQIFTRTITDPVPADQVYKNKAMHIEADAPIVVYGMNRTSYTSDGLLALPTNGLGRDYIVASYAAVAGGVNNELPSQLMVIAPYNNTQVSIEQPMQTANHPEGAKIYVTLDSGDVYSAMTVGYNGDMSGAIIRASKPVAVTAGQNCTYIPNQIQYCCCDHLEEMMLPVSSWGKVYHGISYATRLKGDFWRVFASEPNTKIWLNGNLYATLNQVGGAQGDGWIEYPANGRELVEWVADKPIYVAQYNASSQYDGVQSDPFYLVLTPLEQYQTGLTFSTPASDFPRNYINLACDSVGYYQIEIAPGGTDQWQKLSSYSASNTLKIFPTRINGVTYVGVTFEIKPGTYRMRGPKPFAGYIYGFSNYDSYGYPLSVAVGNIQAADKDAPEIEQQQDCFGNVTAVTSDLPNDPKVRTNISTIELDPDSAATYNYVLKSEQFEPGNTSSVRYTLRVVDADKPAHAILIISDGAGNVTVDTIRYSPTIIAVTPSPIDFGQLLIGSKGRRTATITNFSDRPVMITRVLLKDGAAGFSLVRPVGEFTLGPAGSSTATIEAEVEFDATATGSFHDSLGVRDSCGLRYLALVEASVGQPRIEVSDWDFKKVPVGTTATYQITVTNTGADDAGNLTVTGATGPADAVFTLPGGLPVFPFDLAPKRSKTIKVSFTPGAVQSYADQIVFSSNAPATANNDSIGVLLGQGIKAGILATSYDWEPKRVGSGPHPGTIYLVNIGTAPATLNGTTQITGDQTDFRLLNLDRVKGSILQPGDSVTLQVEFSPTAVGPRQMGIAWDVFPAQSDPPLSNLTGTGIRPLLATNDYDFGTMNVGDPAVTRTVYFWIPFATYLDSVRIVGFDFVSDNASGVPDFRSIPLDSAVVLIPGVRDSVAFTGSFAAQAAGIRNASLRARTSPLDNVDVTSRWVGRGISTNDTSNITGTGASVQGICVGSDGTLTAEILNNGAIAITVDSLRTTSGAFTVLSPDPNAGFTLQSGEKRDVVLRFTPADSGEQKGRLLVYNSSRIPRLDLDITGDAVADTIIARVRLQRNERGNVELGKDLPAVIVLDAVPTGASLRSYRVVFTYDPADLQPRITAGSIRLGDVSAGGGVVTVDTGATRRGTLAIDVALNGDITRAGDMISVPFSVLFNAHMSRAVSARLTINGGECLTVRIVPDSIDVDPVCGLSLRLIELTDGSYSLDQNKPNPFNPVTKITYALGLDGPTQIYLYDAKGGLVQKLIDEYQKPGKYELTLDVTNLPSGNYYYKLVSGTWTETKMLTVVK